VTAVFQKLRTRAALDGATHIFGRHIVEQNRFCAASQGLLQLVERPDFHFDRLGPAAVAVGTLERQSDTTRERDVVLKNIYRMSEAQFRQYWIAKVFRAEASSGPRIVYSNEMAAELTTAIPGAVAFVEATQIPKGLKVLKIDGHMPGDGSYPIHY